MEEHTNVLSLYGKFKGNSIYKKKVTMDFDKETDA